MKNTHCYTRNAKPQPWANDAQRHVWQRAYFQASANYRKAYPKASDDAQHQAAAAAAAVAVAASQ